MKSRERATAALSLRIPDRVPIFDIVDYPIIKEITGKEMGLTRKTAKNDLQTMAECNRKLGLDFFVYYAGYGASEVRAVKYLKEKTYVDEWGAIRRELDLPVLEPAYVGGSIKSEEDFDNFQPPDPQDYASTIVDLQSVLKKIQEDLLLVGGTLGGFTIGMEMRGIANFLIDCHRRPDFARRIMDMTYRFNIEIAKAFAEIGADAILYDDDYADTRGPLIPPRIWRELVKPFQNRFVKECKRRGLWVIEHSDGNLNPILEELIAPKLDALHPIEPNAMKIGQVKREFGDRICVIGNVDCGNTMTLGSEDDVRREVRRCIDEASAGGGYVLSSSNSLHWRIPVVNILAMVDEAKKYGEYRA